MGCVASQKEMLEFSGLWGLSKAALCVTRPRLNTISGRLTPPLWHSQSSPCLSPPSFLVNLFTKYISCRPSWLHSPSLQSARACTNQSYWSLTWRWMVKAWSPLSLLTTSPSTTNGSSSPSSQSPPILKCSKQIMSMNCFWCCLIQQRQPWI